MNKIFAFLGTTIFLLYIFSTGVGASILTIGKNGETIWKVLSYEDDYNLEVPRHSSLEVKKVNEESNNSEESVVNLVKNGDKISLLVDSDFEDREVDVSGINGELVVIEERPDTQQISVGFEDNRFSLQQKNIIAYTNFPIKIDSGSAELSLKTQSGEHFLSIFPAQAVEILVRSNILSSVKENEIEIIEKDNSLQYLIEGDKNLGFLDLVNYTVEVKSRVSAATGEILAIEAPVWYKVVAFLI